MNCLLDTDTNLVLRCQHDDNKAFDEIVARYKDAIFNYISRMIPGRDDVEDLTQEVFVRAFASLKSFRREANLRTWLYRIATNLCVDKYRRNGAEKRTLESLDYDDPDGELKKLDPPDSTHDPERVCVRREIQVEVQKALAKLPDKLRATILLYDMEGMSYEDIAQAMKCPIGTVKSRLFNARMQLREILRPYLEI